MLHAVGSLKVFYALNFRHNENGQTDDCGWQRQKVLLTKKKIKIHNKIRNKLKALRKEVQKPKVKKRLFVVVWLNTPESTSFDLSCFPEFFSFIQYKYIKYLQNVVCTRKCREWLCLFNVFAIIDEDTANKMTSQKKNENKIKTRKNSFDVIRNIAFILWLLQQEKNFCPYISTIIQDTLYMGIAFTISHHWMNCRGE